MQQPQDTLTNEKRLSVCVCAARLVYSGLLGSKSRVQRTSTKWKNMSHKAHRYRLKKKEVALH
eukprot:2686232-Amphidinium_carterae.1